MKKTILFILLALIAVPCFSQVVTRFPNGVSTADMNTTFFDLGTPDKTKYFEYFDDFENYTASEWVVSTTEAGSGDATEAVTDVENGVITLTNAAGDNDADVLERAYETFKFSSGKELWFEVSLKVNDTVESDWFAGLVISQATFPASIASVTGVIFGKDDGDANVDFHVSSLGTTSTASAITTQATDTFVDLGFYYNGSDSVSYFVNGVQLGSLVTTNLTSTELRPAFGIMNGTNAAKTMSVDYIWAIKER